MSALGAKPAAAGGMDPMASAIGVVILLVVIAATYMLAGTGMALMALIGVIVGGVLVGFGVHFVPVGGAPAAMGQAPGIATGVAMLAAGAGLAGLFGGAWAAGQGLVIAVITGGIGGGLMMAITCMFVNFIYVFGMGIPSASGKVAKDPITGDTQAEFKSQGTEGHGLPFISYVGGVIGGTLGGAGGTLIYIMLLDIYQAEPRNDGRTPGTDPADCSLTCRYLCYRDVPCKRGACRIQHHRYHRRTARPEVQEIPQGNRGLGSGLGSLRNGCDHDCCDMRCGNVSKS